MNIRLVEKNAKPGVKDSAERKFYAVPDSDRSRPQRDLSREATQDSSIGVGEYDHALLLFGRKALSELLLGHTVDIPEIGSLRISFKSEGVVQPEDFHNPSMISNPRIIFTPKKEVRALLRTSMSYSINGVRAGGHDYVSIKEYRLQTGTSPVFNPPSEDPVDPNPGGNSGGSGGNSGGTTPPNDDNPDGIE